MQLWIAKVRFVVRFMQPCNSLYLPLWLRISTIFDLIPVSLLWFAHFRLGILSKIKSRIFCLGETYDGRGGGKIKVVFNSAKIRDFIEWEKALIIKGFKTILGFGCGEAAILELSREDKIYVIFFCKDSLIAEFANHTIVHFTRLTSYQLYESQTLFRFCENDSYDPLKIMITLPY